MCWEKCTLKIKLQIEKYVNKKIFCDPNLPVFCVKLLEQNPRIKSLSKQTETASSFNEMVIQ